jgi:hypothetical protein
VLGRCVLALSSTAQSLRPDIDERLLARAQCFPPPGADGSTGVDYDAWTGCPARACR